MVFKELSCFHYHGALSMIEVMKCVG